MKQQELHKLLNGLDRFLLLETTLAGAGERYSYLFEKPEEEITARRADEVPGAVARVEECVRRGRYAAGFLAYELGYCLEDGVFAPPDDGRPLLRMGIYGRPAAVYDAAAGQWVEGGPDDDAAAAPPEFSVSDVTLDETRDSYLSKIEEIKRLIEQGLTYQINYTMRMEFGFEGAAEGLYMLLRERQKVGYSAFWRGGGEAVLSFSPELFFRLDGGELAVRPMKGTVARGGSADEDAARRGFLCRDEKNMAENLMIVDLLRNDLGRISEHGSVSTPSLFDVEPYETLFQMTSTVRSKLKPDVSLLDFFRALFPSGSVTGAPKISSMNIIRRLEKSPRGLYTGAVGFIAPRMEKAVFNVAIRTIEISGGRGRMGIGGGIVYDSSPAAEWDEALLKGSFFTGAAGECAPRGFSLIESLLWSPADGFFLLPLHLERLRASAKYFGFAYSEEAVVAAFEEYVSEFRGDGEPRKVRLALSRGGGIDVSSARIEPPDAAAPPPRCVISGRAILSSNPFLYHKTTVRGFYDEHLARAMEAGYFDIIFTNERGEITEGARTNVVARIGGKLYTPPVSCGLLGGVYRRHLLNAGEASERVLYPADLRAAEEVFVCNSVRGMVKVKLEY